MRDTCEMCKGSIDMQIFKGTGVCCDRCRKARLVRDSKPSEAPDKA